MGRPSVILAEKKTRIVFSVLSGEVSIAGAARRDPGTVYEAWALPCGGWK